ncbi:MAG: response regulator transcription factor [Pedobacter sp.]|nr:MAG: response regulator transcription factor [Pedobacter sp.]
MVMTCLILDDEELCVNQLRKYIEKVPTLHLKASFTNPDDALLYLEREKVDIVFLDMEMPNHALDGLDFARIMGDSQRYIFTTAHPEYALPSYEHNAIYFLHKPYPFEHFTKAVQRAKQLLEVLAREDIAVMNNYTFVRVDGSLQRVNFDDICWIESERNGIWFNTETNRFHSALTISDMMTRLPTHQFVRIHKSFIIPVNKAEVINKDSISVLKEGKLHEIPIGETYRKEFITLIENKVMKK